MSHQIHAPKSRNLWWEATWAEAARAEAARAGADPGSRLNSLTADCRALGSPDSVYRLFRYVRAVSERIGSVMLELDGAVLSLGLSFANIENRAGGSRRVSFKRASCVAFGDNRLLSRSLTRLSVQHVLLRCRGVKTRGRRSSCADHVAASHYLHHSSL